MVLNRVDVMPALLTAIGALGAMNARALRRAQLTEGVGGGLSGRTVTRSAFDMMSCPYSPTPLAKLWPTWNGL